MEKERNSRPSKKPRKKVCKQALALTTSVSSQLLSREQDTSLCFLISATNS